MAETLLAWFHQYTESPKRLEARLLGQWLLSYEPPEREGDEEYHLRTQSGLAPASIGGGEPLAVIIEKTKDNAFRERITIGRTSNNDLVLDDASVSRFHAWFQRASDTSPWKLFDAGSRNGTSVNGVRLAAKAGVDLVDGTRLRIGVVDLTFFSATGFLAMLRRRANA